VALAGLLAMAMAGCSGDGGPADANGTDRVGFEEFALPADGLAVRGVVVNEAIVPQRDVRVVLDGGRNTTTTANGTFAFADVAAGVHVLKAGRLGLLEATTTVSVQTPDDPVVRIVMLVDAETVPYHQVLHVEMFLQCGVGAPGTSYSTCQTPNGASDIVCVTLSVCLGHPLEHNGLVEVDPGPGAPEFSQAEAVWDATNPSAEELLWNMFARTPGTIDFDNGTGLDGPSPVIMPWNKTELAGAQIGQGKIFVFQVYPSSETPGVVLQQRVDLFITLFYNYSPAEDWTLAADGEPVDPR
jgi:hypothetical protein